MKLLDSLAPDLSAPGHRYLRGDFASNPLSEDEIYEGFLGWIASRDMELYPAQDEAVLEVANGSNVILATPTGSGKSTVAVAAHFAGLARGARSYYTAPIKALVSEKFFDLCEIFGAENVGMVTGDSAVNQNAPIVCCTAEILANVALREGADADLGVVIMDEFHFYSDPQRGWAWQVPLIELPQAQFLLMSATLGDVTRIENRLNETTGRSTALVSSAERPIPLHHYYSERPVHEELEELLSTHQAPVYVVHFSQLQAAEQAQNLMSVDVLSKDEKQRVAELIKDFRFSAGFGKTLNRLVRHGIGVHHAGMLPKYRRLVEQLAQTGLLKVICGTDTLGVGINVPIRTVLITALSKFDGRRTRRLSAREFHQIAGRAGRAGYDTAGTVVVQAPEHVIENERAMAKARAKHGDDQKKLRQVPKKKPPEGFVSWSRKTFESLVAAQPEQLTSSFAITHSMVLNMLQRPGDNIGAGYRLLTSVDEPRPRQRLLLRQALAILKELLRAGVVVRLHEPDETGRRYRLTVELQENFALNQPLSPFALAALTLLDPESETYALDVVSVIEATLEKPRQVLNLQEKKVKGEALATMKADGLEYMERMRELDEITYPQPLRELLEQSFETYRSSAPWVAQFELSPKSVVRDMYERAMTFGDYVQFYGLARSEGILLRYLSDAYKALRQTVPVDATTESLTDLVEWLGESIRQTDNSLLDEWEKLASGEESPMGTGADSLKELVAEQPEGVTANPRAFRVMVRNALFQRVELFAQEKDKVLGALDERTGWDRDRWADAMDTYFDEYEDIYTDAQSRGPSLIRITEDPEGMTGFWTVTQVFDDPDGHHDWGINARVDLAASDEDGFPVVLVDNVGPITDTRR
ncbi:DEAD/DEAH box helicase [Kocuria marina]|uniref:DEAD/DEAH box helicase n=1 Tax=Kocuria marina TaxID=223184 RepID=A0A0B0DC89_9MICC|nr:MULTISPECIES: DEAD/DEAH box helicase [Kocuria]KHE75018.1 DEAD/DEAH box helicase [Kocuria marina]